MRFFFALCIALLTYKVITFNDRIAALEVVAGIFAQKLQHIEGGDEDTKGNTPLVELPKKKVR